MKKSRLVLGLLAAPLAIMTVSCGDSEPAGASGSISSSAMTAVVGTTALSDFTGSLKLSATGSVGLPFSNLPSGVGFMATALGDDVQAQAVSYTSCTTTTGSSTDGADGDSIPLSYRQDYSCYDLPDGNNGLTTLSGYYSVVDMDDSKYGSLGGYRFTFDFAYDDRMSHETNEGSWKGEFENTISSSSISYSGSYSAMGGSTPTSGVGVSKWTWSANHNTTYTPTSIAQPWAAGTMSVSGFYRISGVIYDSGTSTSHNVDVTFEVTSNSLEYDRTACTTGFYKNGSLRLTDGGGNVLLYNYSNCTQTRQFNGTVF